MFVADWQARVTANPALVGPDHVHPVAPAGTTAFADVVASAVGAAAPPAAVSWAADSSPGPSPPWTQAQLQAAVAQYDPAQAQVLGAIAMAETGGQAFPSVNRTGVYHGPWAFQEASNPGLDFHRLDTDLHYAAQQAAKLASTGITHQKWETWPTMAQKFLHRPATGGAGAALPQTASANTTCTTSVAFSGARRNSVSGRLDVPAAHHASCHSPRQSDGDRAVRDMVLHQPDELPPRLQRGGHHGTDRHAGAGTGVRRGRHDAHRPVE